MSEFRTFTIRLSEEYHAKLHSFCYDHRYPKSVLLRYLVEDFFDDSEEFRESFVEYFNGVYGDPRKCVQ